jgi:hypothetical protein
VFVTDNVRPLETRVVSSGLWGVRALRFFLVEDSRICGEWVCGRVSRWS